MKVGIATLVLVILAVALGSCADEESTTDEARLGYCSIPLRQRSLASSYSMNPCRFLRWQGPWSC